MYSPQDKAECVTEKITRLFAKDNSLTGIFRDDIGTALSFMVKKYFKLTSKVKELLEMLKPEISNSRLRDVVDFEVDYIRKSYEQEISERDELLSEKDNLISVKEELISEKDNLISLKDEEISFLKAKLRENGID